MFSIYFNLLSPVVSMGNTQALIINSYLQDPKTLVIPEKPAVSKLTASATSTPKKEQVIDKSALPLHAIVTKKFNARESKNVAAAIPFKSASNQGVQTNELIALLHTAIQKQQHYPASALEMERSGRVTLKFLLHPNGTISELKIIHSSGTSSLDEAALNAVNDAVPFQQVQNYLNVPQDYSIDVAFELT